MESMGTDLTVVAIPFYIGSIEWERRQLQRRAELHGASPADYTRGDTLASLTMGLASLLAPLVASRLVAKIVPGQGKYGRVLVTTALATAAVTTVADRWAAPVEEATDEELSDRQRWARRVRRVSGPVAVSTAIAATATWVSHHTSAARLWERGGRDRDLGEGLLGWAVAVAGWDFIYYWNHRLMHEVRGMWAIHVPHHSSEHYNLSTALRQPVADVAGVYLPYGILAWLGVRPRLVVQARAINLLYQFWIHTDVIRTVGGGEAVLNTPSHHRVHHGSNSAYLDRNHGSILIIWDRIFGTFQREEEPVVFGLTKNIKTDNPVVISTHEYRDIVRDVSGSTTWKQRWSFVLRGPGWAYQRHAERARASAARN